MCNGCVTNTFFSYAGHKFSTKITFCLATSSLCKIFGVQNLLKHFMYPVKFPHFVFLHDLSQYSKLIITGINSSSMCYHTRHYVMCSFSDMLPASLLIFVIRFISISKISAFNSNFVTILSLIIFFFFFTL